MFYKFFNKKSGSGISVNEQLAEELHKLVIKKCNWRKVYARFKDNIWVTDLAKMGSLSSKNKKLNIQICAIDVFTKYGWANAFKVLKQFLMI